MREHGSGYPTAEPPPADNAPERTSAARNPWRWATAGVAVLAIAFGIWALNERSNANDAKADLQAQEAKAASATQQPSETPTRPRPRRPTTRA